MSPRRPILRLRANADRALIEATVAALIDLLDARDAPMADREPDLYLRDADPDAEPDHDGEQDNEDCCPARDDEPRAGGARGCEAGHYGSGAEDDAESSLGWPERPGRRGELDQSLNRVGDHTSERECDRCDEEPDDEDGCLAGDDYPHSTPGGAYRPGDPDDAEPGADDEPHGFDRAADPAFLAARARHAAKPRRATPGVVWL